MMRVRRIVAAGLALGFVAILTLGAGEARAQAAASAEAFGVYVKTLTVEQPKSPFAQLTGDAVMAHDEALNVGVPGLVNTANLFATVTGAGDSYDVSSQSSSTLESITILDGLITADLVIAIASSAIHGTTVNSNADGATFANLIVNGAPIAPDVAPNTKIPLPGVGYVLLNEQTRSGDGVTSTGLAVRMIHVVLEECLLTCVKTGEIIVGAASSYVAQ